MGNEAKVSRRQFCSSAASFAVPYFIPSGVLGQSNRPGANERVNVGIIGAGQRGRQLARNIPPDCQVIAVCDVDGIKISQILKEHGAKWRTAKDYRELLDHQDLDAVLVCATDVHHVHAAVLACMAGKDVYVEKPLSLYLKEGRSLVDAARQYSRIVQTGTQQRSMEMNQFACEFVRDGGIGRVRVVECVNFDGPKLYDDRLFATQTVPADLDWDLWQGQARDRPYHRRLASHWTEGHPNWWGQWWDYSGNNVTGLGAHAFDMVQYALGMDETGPVEFWPVENGENARIHFRYANGVEVRLRFEDQKPYRGPRLGAVFTGSEAKIEINRNKFTTNPHDLVKHPPDARLADAWNGPGWIAKGHIQNWLDCIKSRRRPVADVEIGHRSASVCHLCNITRQLGRRLRWDPARETFVGDDEANVLLDRPRRVGWELPSV